MATNLIKPFDLGALSFPTNLIQAPLAGVSCAPFRELIWHFGGPAYCVSEMISAKTLLHRPAKRYIYKSPHEGPLSTQLSGNNPQELHEATQRAISFGSDLIDLNCGCPVDKIRKKNCGSKLLSMSQHLYELIKSIKAATKVPVSVKIRIDADSGDQFNSDVVKAINDAGADALVVHGRHWTEGYDVNVRLDEIANIVNASNIPVIGNGDVRDYASLKQMFRVTGCAAVMIGRASVGRPWLFQQLLAEDRGEVYTPPSKKAIGALFLKHIAGLSELENQTLAVLQARKLSKYYARAAGLAPEIYLQFNAMTHFDKLQQLIEDLFC